MGRRQHISKEGVIDAAVAILDDEGVAGLSLERIAREVGVRGPSLYYHYPDKSAILAAVARRVIGDLDVLRPETDWEAWLVDNALAFHDRVMAHPHAASLLMEHLSPRAVLVGFGRGAQLLTEAGVDPAIHMQLMEGVQHLAWGFTLYRAVLATSDVDPFADPAEQWPELGEARRRDRWRDGRQTLERSVRSYLSGTLAVLSDVEPRPEPASLSDEETTR